MIQEANSVLPALHVKSEASTKSATSKKYRISLPNNGPSNAHLKSSLDVGQPTAAEAIEAGECQDQYWTSEKGLGDIDNLLEVRGRRGYLLETYLLSAALCHIPRLSLSIDP